MEQDELALFSKNPTSNCRTLENTEPNMFRFVSSLSKTTSESKSIADRVRHGAFHCQLWSKNAIYLAATAVLLSSSECMEIAIAALVSKSYKVYFSAICLHYWPFDKVGDGRVTFGAIFI